ICSGPRSGKQFTYALLEERVPRARTLTREESLAELVRRYFTSHGPAMVKDFVWWSGLTVADARAGIEMAGSTLARETSDGKTYWVPSHAQTARRNPHPAHLLPAYDEALLSYRDNRGAYAAHMGQLMRDSGQTIVIDGRAVGTWRRTISDSELMVQVKPFTRLSRRETQAIAEAADRYGAFLNLDARLIR
ncbi:MAG: DNA glycosylase AlkZ-like family protein, partial [Vicinamibacterales bacterium]